MDWDLAIKRNSKALKGIIDVLFALLGLDGTDAASRIPRSLHSAVLGVLRPAESAVRRLIVIAAPNVVVKLAPSRPMPAGKVIGKGRVDSLPSFQLFDPRKRIKLARAMKVRRIEPRIRFIDYDPRICALFPAPGPWSFPRRRPMAASMPRDSTGGFRPSSRPSMISRARPNVLYAGMRGGRPRPIRNSSRRCGPAILRATAGSIFTKSTRFSPTATFSPVRP